MRTPGNETIVVKPELIRLVRRDDSKKWQAHYKLENLKTWFRRSTDTANALFVAVTTVLLQTLKWATEALIPIA